MTHHPHRLLPTRADASSVERTVDITTTGARTGHARRIEIWIHHLDGAWYLTGSPGHRAWFANIRAHPALIVHPRTGGDLPAEGVVITEPHERRRILEPLLAGLESVGGRWRNVSDQLDAWVATSPLVEVRFPPHLVAPNDQ